MKRTHVKFKFSDDFADVKKDDVKVLYRPLANSLERRKLGKVQKAGKAPVNKMEKEPLSNK